MVKLGSLDIASHYIGETAVPKTYKCEDTVFSAGGTGFTADVLIIGGGGGGGQRLAGGGGGGGYREFTKKFFTGINYTVTVGAGGSGSTSDSAAGSDGSNSSIERIAHGGGGGGSVFTQQTGRDGGSGGGSSANELSNAGNSISPRCNGSSQGNAGGVGYKTAINYRGGGGGGASASGATGQVSGDGGDGKTSTITGSSATYAGGGGGGGYNTSQLPAGSGGAGGGGNGSDTWNGTAANSAGDNGTVNTGGGGGGGTQQIAFPYAGANGGNGGSGFVVIKFPDTYSITIGGGLTYTSSTSGGYTTVQFTAGTDTISFSSFNPASISGLQLWLDADDSETITLNGSTVSQWDDKSGNNYHVSQATASNQPTFTASALNSKSVVRFDGVNDGLINTGDTPVGGSTNRTVFIVFNFNGTTIDYALVLGYNGALNGKAFGISEEIAVRVNNGNRVWTTAVDSTHAIVTIVLDGTSTTDLSAWKNGSSLTASSTATQTIDTQSGVGIGRSPAGNHLNGDVAEIIVYNSALSTSDRESVESYLSTKWGISVAEAASDEYTNSLLLYPLDSDANDASSTGNNLTLTNASIDTSVKKYGAGSLKFTGSLSNGKAQGVMPSLGTGDFTIEFWLYMASMSNGQYILDRGQGSNAFYDNPGFAFLTTTSSRFYWGIQDSYDSEEGGYGASVGLVSSSLSSAVGSWVHVALVRQGTTYRMYIDGTQETSGTGSATDFAQHNFAVGDAMINGGGVAQNSYIDDFRLSNTAVYPDGTTFTVPSAAHSTS